MTRYEARVSIQVHLQYEIVLQVDADDVAEAQDKLHHQALGMKRAELDRLAFSADEANASSYYDGETTVVDPMDVGQIEEVEDEAGA